MNTSVPDVSAMRVTPDSIQALVPSSVEAVSNMQNAQMMNSGRRTSRNIRPVETLAWTRSVSGNRWPRLNRPYKSRGTYTRQYLNCHDGNDGTTWSSFSGTGSMM